MQTFKKIFLLVILIIIILGFKVILNNEGSRLIDPSSHKPLTGMTDIYTCPMHPQVVSDKPGDCPICFMKLVKKDKLGEKTTPRHQHPTVELTPAQQTLMGIRTVVVENRPLVKTVRASGKVASNLEMYQVQNDFVGAYVEYVNTFRDYERIKDRRRTWDIHRELQTKLLESHNKLLQLGLSEAEILKLQQVDRWQIWNQPELALFQENQNYWIVADVAESDIGFVDVPQKVHVNIPSYNEKIEGVVRSVGGAIDPESRRVRVLIELPEYKGELIANMLATVDIVVDMGKSIAVPREAVIDLGTRKIVYVETTHGEFQTREIEVAWGASGYLSISKGLQVGERVVVDGNFLLDSESRLKSSFMNATGGGHDH